MANTKITNLAEKATGEAADEFAINDAGADKKMGMDGIRITESQVTDLQSYLLLAGGTMTGDVIFNDNIKALFGTGSDASILYDGTDLVIKTDEVGTGSLSVTTPDDTLNAGLAVKNSDGSIELVNGTATAGAFNAVIRGTPGGTSGHTTFLIAAIPVALDSGTTPALIIDSRQADNTPLVTRPLLQVRNNGAIKLEIDVNGNVDMRGNDILGGGVVTLIEQAEANADVATEGQIWVNTAIPNELFFTNDVGTDFQLASLAGTETFTNKTIDGDLNTFIDINETQMDVSVGASGTILTSNGVGVAPTYQAAVAADNLGNHTATEALKMADFDLTNVGNITLSNVVSSGSSAVEIFATGSNIIYNIPTGQVHVFRVQGTNIYTFSSTEMDFNGRNITDIGVLTLKEQAEADADVAGQGQIWVDTQTPNKLFFTDDAGTDFDLTAGGSTTFTDAVLCTMEVPEGTVAFPDIHTLATAGAKVDGFVLPDGASTSTINFKCVIPRDIASTPAMKIRVRFMTQAADTDHAVRLTVSTIGIAVNEVLDQALTAETEVTAECANTTETMNEVVIEVDLTTDWAADDTVIGQLKRDPTDAVDDFAGDILIVGIELLVDRTIS